MGYDVDTFVMVGIRTLKSKMYTKSPVPKCGHSIPSRAKFCPACGTLASSMWDVPIPGFDGNETYKDLEVRSTSGDDEIVVVGICVASNATDSSTDKGPTKIDKDELDKIVAKVESSIYGDPVSEIGEFGIWLCLYESY